MDNSLTLDLIINRKKYPYIYNTNLLIITIILIFTYIIFTYKYETYYIVKGRMTSNELELLISINDLKYLKNNQELIIDDNRYRYQIVKISDEIYLDESYSNYKYVYLQIDGITNIDNYVYQIKVTKKNQIIAKYLKEYL